jgi:hypothetical protein
LSPPGSGFKSKQNKKSARKLSNPEDGGDILLRNVVDFNELRDVISMNVKLPL